MPKRQFDLDQHLLGQETGHDDHRVTGRIESNSSLCARPTASASARSVMYIRVWITRSRGQPARSRASSPTVNAVIACRYASPDADEFAVDGRGAAGGDEQVARPHDPAVADQIFERPTRAEPLDRGGHRTAAIASGSVNAPA